MTATPLLKASSGVRIRLGLAALLALFLLGGIPVQTSAAEYDPQEAGHPLRVVAYLIYPVGLIADYCLMRPAFWLVRREPMATLFGYKLIKSADMENDSSPGNP